MWICLNDAFLSIVEFPPNKRLLIVRARKREDILAAFPDVRVLHTPDRDYQFRAVMSRKTVAHMLANKVEQIDYDNLKDSVADDERHDAYLEIWTTMMQWSKGWFRPKPKSKMKARATRSVILPSVASDA